MDFNLADVQEAVASALGPRDCIRFRGRTLSYAAFDERTRRVANVFRSEGLGARGERCGLAGHESHQDHLALYLHNGTEYLEAAIGAFKARAAPFNVNYRYVADELRYLLDDAQARGIVYHAAFAPTLATVLKDVPTLDVLLQVADGSGNELLPGALDYEDAVTAASSRPPDVVRSPDDLSILYTGGTTGMPKGVLWRQADLFVAALGGHGTDADRTEHESLQSFVDQVLEAEPLRVLPAPPMMHGAAFWTSLHSMLNGRTIVIQDAVTRFDPHDILQTIEREHVEELVIVGDAFARPLLDAVATRKAEGSEYDLSSLGSILSGGARLSPALKEQLLCAFPGISLREGVGASETGSQLEHVSVADAVAPSRIFTLAPGSCVLNETLDAPLSPGQPGLGWLAKRDRMPLGYFGDPEKTAETFPIVDGARYAVPGDRVEMRPDGLVELHGRDSVTINSGGEKIFADEVERAIAGHPAVFDTVVVGRPNERWGEEVVAVVALRDGSPADDDMRQALVEETARHLARFKLPKTVLFVDRVERSPSGKPDYRWARAIATVATDG